MFARTERLLLRPGWAEDAPALAAAIADEMIVRNLATAPWPYRLRDAEAFLAQPRDPVLPSFLIFERTDGAPRLVGSCGLGRRPSGAVELGYWISRPYWGHGYATEAGLALIDIARTLGFMPLGISAPRLSCARGTEAQARLLRLTLTARSDEQEDEALAA